MGAAALALVLTSAGLHATWNLAAKRVRGGVEVTWAYAAVAAATLTPAGAWAFREAGGLPPLAWGFVVGSALLHVGYFVALQRGYGAGDLSLVYPLARGSGPALATVIAVVALGERPGPLAWAGTALVAGSAFALTGGGARASGRAVRLGLITGGFIAAYTVWDAAAVARVGAAPLVYAWASEVVRASLLAPAAWIRRDALRRAWRASARGVVLVGVLSPLAYLLVLYAFRLAPVSLVAPAREVSILLGVAAGTGLLGEGQVARRLGAAAGMAVGVTLLAVAKGG